MDLRHILNKLDSLNEEELTPDQLLNQKKWDFAHKKEHLFSLLQKLRALVNSKETQPGAPSSTPTTPSTTAPAPSQDTLAQQTGVTARAVAGPNGSMTYTNAPRGEFLPDTSSPENIQLLRDKAAELIKAGDSAKAKIYTDTADRLSKNPTQIKESTLAKNLVESFNYEYVTEAGAWDVVKGGLKKLVLPITAAIEIWDAWQKIKALPADMPVEDKRVEITKIIGKQVAEFGVFTVGAAIGGIIGGSIAGPMGIVTALAGGVAANYAFDDDVDKLVDWVVESLYGNDTTTPTDQPTEPDTSPATPAPTKEVDLNELMKEVTREVQTNLQDAGFDVGKHGIDGIFGPDTMAALRAFKDQLGAESDLDALLQLVDFNEEEEPVQESIDVSTVEGMASLRDTLSQLDEIRWPWKPKIPKGPPVEPKPVEPKPVEPKPAEPKPAEPAPKEPPPAEPKPAEPAPKEPTTTPEKVKQELESKSPKVKSAFDSLRRFARKIGRRWRFTKFAALIAALAGAGYYLWDNNGDITTNEPFQGGSGKPDQPATPAQTSTPSCSKEVVDLVNQIKLDIVQLKMFQDPQIEPDARKAIDHAEKTLQLYAPGC